MNNFTRTQALRVALCVPLAFLVASAAADSAREDIIVNCQRPCTEASAAIRGIGGQVTRQFSNVDAIAGSIPAGMRAVLGSMLGDDSVRKDEWISPPRPQKSVDVSSQLATGQIYVLPDAALTAADTALPDNYLFNNSLTGAATVHSSGNTGQGSIVAVIDTGTANWPGVVALAGNVIGGESLVPGATEPSATSRSNNAHGTFVGSMIAAHALFGFASTSTLVRALNLNAPGNTIPCPTAIAPGCPAGVSLIPMIGTAPSARLYALKVFPKTGGGAPESRIIAAMDRAITMRRNFNNGMAVVPVAGNGSEDSPFVYNSLKIDVVNMSLGGPTLYAGRDLEDQLTQEMLKVGITIVTSAGNDGFAAMTGGSPGTGLGSLTVGAANDAVHERILRDLQFGAGVGSLYHPSTHIQTADFSSRGPTADGRYDPDILANGYANFAQVASGGLSIGSGTSFSGPTVAGAAALLRRASATATATQIRNALVQTANPNLVGDRSTRNDQGRGFVSIPAAVALLQQGGASNKLRDNSEDLEGKVVENLERLGIRPVELRNGTFRTHVSNLVPGQVAQFYVDADAATQQLTVSLSNITPALPAAQQNQLFGDDVFVQIVDAPTSFAELRELDFVAANKSYVVDQPQTGLVRVALQGDWTNAGAVSADVTVSRVRESLEKKTDSGIVRQGQTVPVEVAIPAGTKQLVFDLHWKGNWSRYPTNDIDLILVDPSGVPRFDGATISSPERVVIDNPAAGLWTALVDGFTVRPRQDDDDHEHEHDGNSPGNPQDEWKLFVTADGKLLKRH